MANTVHVPYPGQNECGGLCGQKIYDPCLPVGCNLGNLYPGKMVFISGIPDPRSPREKTKQIHVSSVRALMARFSINFKNGSKKTNAFHFDVRFNYGNNNDEIIRNARLDQAWGREEKSLSKPFPFGRDKYFEMIVLIEKNCYKVALNGEHLLEFNHRYPFEKVDTLRVRGDVRICMVRIQG